jgi:hypothetical protein
MATKPVKAPVAGQSGYEPPMGEETIVQPTKIEDGPKNQTPGGTSIAHDESAIEFLNWLQSSGCPAKNLMAARMHFQGKAEQAIRAGLPQEKSEAAFRYLESAEERGDPATNEGTLRRGGKRIWGDGWDLESAMQNAPAEEMKKLREENAQLQGQLAAKNSEIASLRAEIEYQKDKLKENARQLDYLRPLCKPEDLQTIGAQATAAA